MPKAGSQWLRVIFKQKIASNEVTDGGEQLETVIDLGICTATRAWNLDCNVTGAIPKISKN